MNIRKKKSYKNYEYNMMQDSSDMYRDQSMTEKPLFNSKSVSTISMKKNKLLKY